jgi:hypothetical protein
MNEHHAGGARVRTDAPVTAALRHSGVEIMQHLPPAMHARAREQQHAPFEAAMRSVHV